MFIYMFCCTYFCFVCFVDVDKMGNLHVGCVKLKCQRLRAEVVNLKVEKLDVETALAISLP